MARSEARIQTAIWEDDDFLALAAGPQRMFMLLLSQDDLAHDGVIALRERRWSGKATDTTPASVEDDLSALAETGFIVVDERTEELLVRSFIRGDKVYRQPNVLKAAADHLPLVKSRAIRAALLAELERVQSEPMHEDSAKTLAGMIETLRPTEPPGGNPSGGGSGMPRPNPNGIPTDVPSGGSPGERGRTKRDQYEDQIFPVAPEPRPHAPRAPRHLAAAEAKRAGEPTPTQRSKAITDAYAEVEPMSKWPAVNAIVLKAIQAGRWSDAEIHDAMQRLAADRRGVTVETLRYELTGPPASRASPLGLVDRDGMRLKPETAARMDDDRRWRAADAARNNPTQLAIGGTAS